MSVACLELYSCELVVRERQTPYSEVNEMIL